ncbi:hypothetical protein E9993_00800 [Labilibacter sediminis]|nr:hypothetical protein E9993_00800 [Labilibacter sediminis]
MFELLRKEEASFSDLDKPTVPASRQAGVFIAKGRSLDFLCFLSFIKKRKGSQGFRDEVPEINDLIQKF